MHMFVNTFIYNQQSSNNRHSSEALEKVAVCEHALLRTYTLLYIRQNDLAHMQQARRAPVRMRMYTFPEVSS